MRQRVVIILKKIGIFRYVKDFVDTLRYHFISRVEYYNQEEEVYSIFDLQDKIVYDIGTADDGVESFLRSGAKKVIGIEPGKKFYKRIYRKYRNNEKVKLLNIAVGEEDTKKEMIVCNSGYFSTFSEDQVRIVKENEASKNLEFYKKEEVKMLKLDTIIEENGIPYFCKIDVEGYELQVLKGLSKKIPIISFEYNTSLIKNAEKCILLLEELGEYEYNFTERLRVDMKLDEWVGPLEMVKALNTLNYDEMAYGDVYARLKDDNLHSKIKTEVQND